MKASMDGRNNNVHLSGSCCSAKKLELPAEQEEAKQEKQAVTEEGNFIDMVVWSRSCE